MGSQIVYFEPLLQTRANHICIETMVRPFPYSIVRVLFIGVCYIAASLSVAFTAAAQAPGYEWAKTFAAVGFADRTASIMALDATGNMYVTGSFTGTVDFDPGSPMFNLATPPANYRDVYVMKLSPDGTFMWAVSFGAKGVDVGDAIAVSPAGDVFVTGRVLNTVDFDPGPNEHILNPIDSIDGDIFFMRLTTNGQFVWAERIGGTYAQRNGLEVNALALDGASNMYAFGRLSEEVDFDAGETFNVLAPALTDSLNDDDYYVLKMDGNGAFEWVRAFARISRPAPTDVGVETYAHSMTLDASNNIYLVGGFDGEMDFDPSGLVTALRSAGKADGFVCKLRDNGDFAWAKRIGGAQNDLMSDVAVGAGYIAITGHYVGTIDIDPGTAVQNSTAPSIVESFVLKLNPASGEYVNSVHFGGTATVAGGAVGRSIALDPVGNMYIAGNFYGVAEFNPGVLDVPLVSTGTSPGSSYTDIYIVSLTAAGEYRWLWGAGNVGSYEFLFGLHALPAGKLLAQGCFANTIDVDPCPTTQNLVSPDWTAPFLLMLNQDGCISGVEEESTEQPLTVYPNPAHQSITIRSTSDIEGSGIVIRSITGEVVKQWKGLQRMPKSNQASYTISIDLHDLSAGAYFVELITASGVVQTTSMILE